MTTSQNLTITAPSYNGGPTFRVGDEVRNLYLYCGGDHEIYGTVRGIVGPYDVLVARKSDGQTRRLRVGQMAHPLT